MENTREMIGFLLKIAKDFFNKTRFDLANVYFGVTIFFRATHSTQHGLDGDGR
jgi:hypothetical protein